MGHNLAGDIRSFGKNRPFNAASQVAAFLPLVVAVDVPGAVSILLFVVAGVFFSMALGHRKKIILQQAQADASLRVSEQRYGILLELMDEGYCVVEMIRDANGKAVDYRFVEINPAFEKQTGLVDGLGKTIRQMVPGHDAHWFEIYGKVADTGESLRFENHAKAMGRYYDVFAYRIGGSGSERVGILFKDITQNKQMLQDLVAAKEEAELANRAKDSFLATMSHEIRTPLAGILGMLELLSMTTLGNDQRATLDAAWDSSKSLLRIVSDILDWSKIEEGKLELVPESTSIPQLLQVVTNTFSRVASAKALVLSQQTDPRLSSAHIVDALRLSQLLNNFVSNAIKFTLSGKVEVQAEWLERVASGERIRFSVRDTGIGISRQVQEQLFQRYRQGSNTTARLYGGTGLGLAICRRLAELLDGHIELESEPGRGSTFSLVLTLPIASSPIHEMATQTPGLVAQRMVTPLFAEGMNAPRVLAVDDHPINRDLLSQQIRLLGLQVITAENGKVALKEWSRGGFALIISDCHMPEMDGFALATAIRKIEAREQQPRIPIIAWTANAHAEESERCVAAGMDELLLKPTDMRQLKKMLATCLGIPETERDKLVTALQAGDGSVSPIDYDVLSQVAPDRGTHGRILRDFQTQVRSDFANIIEALKQGDEESVEHAAHLMKGSCQMVGATHLAKVCGAIETAARHLDIAGARASKPALESAFRQLGKLPLDAENMGANQQGNGDKGSTTSTLH